MEEIQIDAETGVQQPEAAGPTSGTGLEQEDPHHLNPNPNLNAGLSILVSSLYPQVLEIYRLLYAASTTSSSSDGDPNNNKADIDGAAMDAGESGVGKKEVEVKDPTVRPDVKGAEVAKLVGLSYSFPSFVMSCFVVYFFVAIGAFNRGVQKLDGSLSSRGPWSPRTS